jgi:hypothetical protein
MKKINNWMLMALLGGLILVFIGIRTFLSPRLESNLPQRLTEIDSAKVTSLVILPAKARNSEIQLVRKAQKWELKSGDRTGHLEQGGAVAALRLLTALKPQRIVSKKKEKWIEFQVDDSTGTHVKVLANQNTEADVWIGRTGFSQGGVMNGTSFTYVRLNGEKEVYAVEGFLEAQFNRDFNGWRDKSFLRIKRDSIDRIVFHYPSDSSYTLEKRMGKWTSSTQIADSVSVTSYLAGLEFKNLSGFAEVAPAGEAPLTVTFEKKGYPQARVEAWPSTGSWTLRSSHQPDTYFSDMGPHVVQDLLAGRKKFIK